MSRLLRHQIWFVWKTVQVRLRFVLLLGLAFVVVGQWDRIRTGWSSAWNKISGKSGSDQAVAPDIEFFCPMDPGVISDWPSICPVCNMALVKRKKGEMATLPEGVVARMQFAPYRVQLAGIQTQVARRKQLVYDYAFAGELTASNSKSPQELLLTVKLPPRLASIAWKDRTAKVSARDLPGVEPLQAQVQSQQQSELVLKVLNPHELLQPGLWATADFQIPYHELPAFRSAELSDTVRGVVTVPESAVVDFGTQRLVYVESEPGTFDGREVVLGPRCGTEFPVIHGLTAGQKVAVTGAFLIDAESRLNSNVATSYFGAAQQTSETVSDEPAASTTSGDSPASPKPGTQTESGVTSKAPPLSKTDLALVKKQRICPVTGLPLDSMGGPMPVVVNGRRVFICCEGCETRLKKTPEKFLLQIPK